MLIISKKDHLEHILLLLANINMYKKSAFNIVTSTFSLSHFSVVLALHINCLTY